MFKCINFIFFICWHLFDNQQYGIFSKINYRLQKTIQNTKESLRNMLKDPLNNRQVKQAKPPIQIPLNSSDIFREGGFIDWIILRDHLKNQGRIKEQDFQKLIRIATSMFRSQPNLIKVQDPVTIVGDIHGQFYDFLKIIEPQIGGSPDQNKYLFLGDYVDRGNYSIQVLILILALKISHPKSLFLLRGNHQCRHMTSHFNFKFQCLKKFNQFTYDLIMEMFDCLPLACLINQRFLCIHGGISHEIKNLSDIKRVNRFREIPNSGLFCDLMWADPIQNPQGFCDSLVIKNQNRKCSYIFGEELSRRFLDHNKLVSIIRAHQAQAEGYRMHKWGGTGKFPMIITIFSAPNYCDYLGNKGAVVKFVKNTLNIQQFKQNPHPYILPNFMDTFSWSIPFVIHKVTQILYHLIKTNVKNKNEEVPLQLQDKKKIIQLLLIESRKNTEQNLMLVNLNGFCPDDKLLETGRFSQFTDESFEEKRLIDITNQSRPI